MHRFYLPPEECQQPWLKLRGREAHHALHVLRLEPGDPVTVLDGVGHLYSCAVHRKEKDSLTLEVNQKEARPALPCRFTLLVGIPKGKLIEDIIQKAVELGVHRVVPLVTERVVSQFDTAGASAKQDKWQQVAVEAIKQCGGAWLAQVEPPQTITTALSRHESSDLSFVGSLQTERRHPHEWIMEYEKKHGCRPQSASVWIGPEGDFTRAELEAIITAGGKPCTLGELTLRVETAAIYCLSFLNYELRRPNAA